MIDAISQLFSTETGSFLGSSVIGWIMTFMSARSSERDKQNERMINALKAQNDCRESTIAATGDWGKVNRRFMMICVCFAVFMLPFIAACLKMDMNYIEKTPTKEWLWGLWTTGGETIITTAKGVLVYGQENLKFVSVIMGFYFGGAFGKRM